MLTGYRAEKLTFDATGPRPRATGARLRTPDTRHAVQVTARREMILSAGAIDGPKLLMLSGIGPAEHLREVGVDVLVDSPGVGENLQDHPEGLVQWEALQPMPTASTQWWQIGIFAGSEGRTTPDLMFHYGSVPFDLNLTRYGYPSSENAFCLTPNVTGAQSKGTVRLATRDYQDKPKVDPRYFTHEHDREVMIRGIRVAREIAAAPALKEWVGKELAPGDAARLRRGALRVHPHHPQHRLPPLVHGEDGCRRRPHGAGLADAAASRVSTACGWPTARSCPT